MDTSQVTEKAAEAKTGLDVLIALIQSLPSIIWALLVFGLAAAFWRPLQQLVFIILRRAKQGEPVKLWVVELERVATPDQVSPSPSGRVQVRQDGNRQPEINKIYSDSRYVMLVEQSFGRETAKRTEWDVVLYLYPHYTDLEHVTRVEYFFDTGWGQTVFETADRKRSFAIKITSWGSVLCTAHVHFDDGYVAKLSRYLLLAS
jgi:hypothetical protein